MKEQIYDGLWRVVENATEKRKGLLRLAGRAAAGRRRLDLTAGVLALFSAGTLVPAGEQYRWLAAALAVASGVISVLKSIALKETEQQQMYEGAAKYLLLRDKAHRHQMSQRLSGEAADAALAEVQSEYAALDAVYGRYLAAGYEGRHLSSAGPRRPGGKADPPAGQ